MKKLVPHFWVAAAGVGVTLLGLMGPWAKVISFVSISVSGFDTDDGKFVALCALGALVVLAAHAAGRGHRVGLVIGALMGLLITAGAGYDLATISSSVGEVNSEFARASVGWGLYATVLGGIAIIAGSLLTIRESRKQGATTDTAAAVMPPVQAESTSA